MNPIMVEVAKSVTASATTAGMSGFGGLLRLAWQKLRSRGIEASFAPGDVQWLAERLDEYANADPHGAVELARALIAENPAAGTAFPWDRSAPFFDRDGVRGAVAGVVSGVLVLSGQHGVGKTRLSRQLAEDLGDRFTDFAQVDLDEWRVGDAVSIPVLQQEVLRQLGVPEREAPAAAVRQQYRSVTARRALLLVIENVVGAAELEPMLPADSSESLTLATTRVLSEDLRLRFPAGRCQQLFGLEPRGAWELLASKCGPDLLAAEPEPTRNLLELCDYLPYAVERVGALLQRRASEPRPVGVLLEELNKAGVRESAELVRFVLDRTFAALPADVAGWCRLLAAHPGPDFTVESAAVWLATLARPVLEQLRDAGLLVPTASGRYRLPYLTRSYVLERSDLPVDFEAAFQRFLCSHRETAVAIDFFLEGPDRLRRYDVTEFAAWTEGSDAAVAWLEAERGVLAELARQAHERGLHEEVCRISGVFEVLLLRRGHHRLCETVNGLGIRSAEELGRRGLLARSRATHGRIATQLHDFQPAEEELAAAEWCLADLDDDDLRASILEFRGRLYEEWTEAIGQYDYTPAVRALTEAVDIDQRAGGRRALGLHLRMLANVLVKHGDAGEALRLLDRAEIAHTGEPRNASRVQTVRAKAHVGLRSPARARVAVQEARRLAAQAGATQYEVELIDVEARIAWQEGDIAQARSLWGGLVQRFQEAGHPKANVYLSELARLPHP